MITLMAVYDADSCAGQCDARCYPRPGQSAGAASAAALTTVPG